MPAEPPLLAVTAAAVLASVLCLWIVSLVLRDAGIVDVAWGPVFAVVAALGWAQGGGWEGRRVLLAVLTTVWGLRLALHIGTRNRARGEDPRYAAWRREHGRSWPLRSLFTVFLLQGAVAWIVSLPVQVGQRASSPARLTWLDAAGAAVWLAGFLVEAVSDWQLLAFKRDPANRGRVLTTGLWRYSRHPNYFGECVLWWGLWIVAAQVPWGWSTAVGPLLLTWLLLRVSGVPMTDELMEGRPGWRRYVERTSAFVPRPPKR